MHAFTAERMLFINRYAVSVGVDQVFKFNETPNGVLENTRLHASIQVR